MKRYSVVILIFLCCGTIYSQSGERATPLQELFVLKELLPGIQEIGVLCQTNSPYFEELTRAATVTQLKVIAVNIEDLRGISKYFKKIVDDVNIIVIGDSKILDEQSARKYLIQNSILKKKALATPNNKWVGEGAFIYVGKNDNQVALSVNKKMASLLEINIPEKMLEKVQFVE